MGAIFICDGCGKQEKGYFLGFQWHKPISGIHDQTKMEHKWLVVELA